LRAFWKILFLLFILTGLRSRSQTVSWGVTPSSPSICIGSSANLYAIAIPASANYIYAWAPANLFTNPSLNTQVVSPTVTTAYTVTVYDSSNPTTTIQATCTVTVKPKIPFSLGPDQTIYSGGTLNLTGPPGATFYNWWGSTSFTSSAQSISIPSITAFDGGYYVLEVDLNGCQTYDSVYVFVPSPIIFTLTPANRTICRGENVNFVIGAAQGPSGIYSYSWTPQTGLSSYLGYTVAGNPLVTTIYTITACDVADPSYTIAYAFTLTANQPPTPSITIPTFARCEPACYGFTSHATPPLSSIIYDFGNGDFVEGDSIIHCMNAGTYYLNVITKGTNGCNGIFNYTTPIVVLPRPASNFSYSPYQPNLTNNVVSFSGSSLYGSPFFYEWTFDEQYSVTDTGSNPVKIFTSIGDHTVHMVARNSFGCVDTVEKLITVYPPFKELELYPNPASGNLIVEIAALKENNPAQIFDARGRLVMNCTLTSQRSVIDVSALAEGFYTLRTEYLGVIRKANFIRK
jgi:hypothetical protein